MFYLNDRSNPPEKELCHVHKAFQSAKKIKKKKILSFKVMKMNGLNVIFPYSFFHTTKYSRQSYPNH